MSSRAARLEVCSYLKLTVFAFGLFSGYGCDADDEKLVLYSTDVFVSWK